MLTFLPQFWLGYHGMPRRYPNYPPSFRFLNILSTAGATVLGLGYLMPFTYLFVSLVRRVPAGPNPWHATGLEWQTSSPPPPSNFVATPVVTAGPYEYARPSEQPVGAGAADAVPLPGAGRGVGALDLPGLPCGTRPG